MLSSTPATVPNKGRTAAANYRKRAIAIVDQDRLLRDCVRAMEQHQRDRKWSWSWLANKSGVATTTISNWRSKKTRSGLTRTMNAALKPLGLQLIIGNIHK